MARGKGTGDGARERWARAWRPACLGLALVCALPGVCAADELAGGVAEFVDLPLEDLLKVEVTSVSKRSQRLADVAAAVHVITADDILHSGARSLPEALRLAPGVDVARIGGDRWAVSIRGHTDYLANKLMVLVDGRSAYSPNFSGVLWNTLQFPLENIERIEVIRGPGGSIWGMNAVNGVINIITRSAMATQGSTVSAGYGNATGPFAMARHGGKLDEDIFFSSYVTAQRGSASAAADGDSAQDGYRDVGAGLRIDSHRGGDSWMLIGNLFHSRADGVGLVPDVSAPGSGYLRRTAILDDLSGIDVQGRFTRLLDDGSELQLNTSWTHSDLDSAMLADERQDIVDLEVQHRLLAAGRHDITWGAGYRWFHDQVTDALVVRIQKPQETLQVASLFAQDEYALRPDLRLTVGARVDHQKYTGAELQPSARLLWNLDARHSLWWAYSQARRAPSRGERTADYQLGVLAPGSATNPSPFPAKLEVRGSDAVVSEHLTAYETGYRGQPGERLFVDASLFLHRYRSLRCTTAGDVETASLPAYLVAPAYFSNQCRLDIRGLELSADWRPGHRWHFQGGYALNENSHFSGGDPIYSSFVPRHILFLRSGWRLNRATDVDLWLRRVGEREVPYAAPIDAYTSLDLRVARRIARGVELSLVGQNLLDARHEEYISQVPGFPPAQIRRGVYAQFRLNY